MSYNNIIYPALFSKHGVKMSYVNTSDKNKSFDFHAFLQPLRYKNKLYLSGVPTELGYDGLKKYLLICPYGISLDDIDGITHRLLFAGESFGVDHCETVHGNGSPLYIWAIIHKEG